MVTQKYTWCPLYFMENTPKVTIVTKPNNQIKYKQNKVKINKLRA